MNAITPEFEAECRILIDRYFATCPDPTKQKQAHKTLRMLRASEKPLQGKVNGWAGGIIYFVVNDCRSPCGVPGMLNAEFEIFMGVSMRTICTRAARLWELATF
jgi:hypothetical protein